MALKFQKLTAKATRALTEPGSIHEHGIVFERLKSGDGRWKVSIMVDGKRVSRAIGFESEGVTRTDCELFIEQKRTEAREGRLNLPAKRKTAMRFSEVADLYMKKPNLKDSNNKRMALDYHLVPFFGSIALGDIDAESIDAYKELRSKQMTRVGGDRKTGKGGHMRPVAPATLLRELSTLRHVLGYAFTKKWLKVKPEVKGFTVDNPRLTYCSEDQVARIFDIAKSDLSPQIYTFMMIGFNVGMRMSEILSIRLEHIDLERRLIFLPKAKMGHRDQPIGGHLAEHLWQFVFPNGADKARDGWLFPSKRSKSGHTVNIRGPWERVILAAGLDPKLVIRHTMRHTSSTHLVRKTDPKTAQRITGHSDIRMLLRYAKTNDESTGAALAIIEDLFTPKLHQD